MNGACDKNLLNQLEQKGILTRNQRGGMKTCRVKIQYKIGEKKIGDKIVNVFA